MMRRRTGGFTLIECLVCVAIAGLLAALLLPALHAARESARRSMCVGHLKQIGVALHGYHASNNCFPHEINYYGASGAGGPGPLKGRPECCSALARILPYIDQAGVFSRINFDVEFYPDYTSPHPANLTAHGAELALYLCPSDTVGGTSPSGNNYRGNFGVGPGLNTSGATPDSANGFLSFPMSLSSNSFPDGLSRTVAYSERLRGTGANAMSAESAARDFGDLAIEPSSVSRSADFALSWCRVASSVNFPHFTGSGYTWLLASRGTTIYCHAQEPNGPIPDALIRMSPSALGIATARSHHFGGVNVLMADGSTRFVADEISRSVWRALGTRNGGELVE